MCAQGQSAVTGPNSVTTPPQHLNPPSPVSSIPPLSPPRRAKLFHCFPPKPSFLHLRSRHCSGFAFRYQRWQILEHRPRVPNPTPKDYLPFAPVHSPLALHSYRHQIHPFLPAPPIVLSSALLSLATPPTPSLSPPPPV
ncbi:hypothetical protein M427DRAFT_56304 [Gonapodya prolifera JEL478]|uniref:Uncharacterized protein n=1 Tax=Gonapodya prolifera (strain JEL478) TaxID=1344416 RepID=A0A139AGX9_GONPJ|nr:hypothetical protein M427DRAFT_56304 [Gonapodya prolifera JEL478]|eukprot:KXS16010.1 hypothetical protein M427DRAFT_56304 [Gonapodya prolifera JEL478]